MMATTKEPLEGAARVWLDPTGRPPGPGLILAPAGRERKVQDKRGRSPRPGGKVGGRGRGTGGGNPLAGAYE